MLKELGRGLMLGGFTKSVQTASYAITMFIFPLLALIILGFFQWDDWENRTAFPPYKFCFL
jgi:hypothetical protein